MQVYQSAFKVQDEEQLFNSDQESELKQPIQIKFYDRQKKISQANEQLQKKIHKQIIQQINSPKISQNSCKLLSQKLEKQLSNVLVNLNTNENLNFEQVGRVLQLVNIFRLIQYDDQYQCNIQITISIEQREIQQLQSIRQIKIKSRSLFILQKMVIHEQIWVLLQENIQDEFVKIEKIYTLLRLLLDPNKLSTSQMSKLLQQFHKNQDWTIEEFLQNLKVLLQNKQYFQVIHQIKDKKMSEYQQKSLIENTHRPRLSSNTNNIISKIDQEIFTVDDNKYKSKFEKRLFYYKQKDYAKQKQIKQIKQQQEQKEIEQCSFQPQICKTQTSRIDRSQSFIDRLYTIEPSIRKQEIKEQAFIRKEQEELRQCTFQPYINDYENRIQNKTSQPKGYEDTIKRMRDASFKNKQKQEQKDKIPNGENYQKLRKNSVRPFSFHNRENIKKEPILQINVKISQNKNAKLTINEGENPLKIVNNFSQTFQLSNQQQQNLVQIIKDNLQ